MAEKMRYNKIIDLLERGKPVFSTSTVPNGSLDDLTYIADADYDAVIIEMEHEGFSFTTLRSSLQVLLNRKRIAEKDNLQPDGRFKSMAQLRAEFGSWGTTPASVVHQCGSGVTACHNLLAMTHAGLGGSLLYPGSWSEWCADPARPVATG